MPRLLLTLSRDAQIVVAGPTTPLHPLMFEFGIKVLAGLVVEDEKSVWRTVADADLPQMAPNGRAAQATLPALRRLARTRGLIHKCG